MLPGPAAPLLPVPPGLTLPERPDEGHKGTFGTVVVIGGAVGFTGAPYLAAMGAARTGASLVRLCVPDPVYPVVASRCVEVMPHPLPATAAGSLATGAVEVLAHHHLPAASAALVGPGLTTAPETCAAVAGLLERLPCPAVVDADGLNIAAGSRLDWRRCPAPLVLTPHPAEMGRLVGMPTLEVQRDRPGVAGSYARDRGVVVVLKGSGTVVAAPDGRRHQGPAGLVALATGGTGDVLGGVVAALLGQGLDPFAAAVAGVTCHAEAGAELQARRGRAGALAGDLLDLLPQSQERIRRALLAP